ncbi:MAG TPA: hypothetical protein VFB06_11170 [Streptosporangiaceae bacterium]|nr:hypothetical protein [Streptosporangiaceae bacterium]
MPTWKVPAVIAVCAGLAGCASLAGSSTPASQVSASASAPPCTTAACVITEIQDTLVGTAAKDGAAFTKFTCSPSSLKVSAGPTYTVKCTAYYSDGMTARGTGNWLLKTGDVTFVPSGA